MTSLQMFSILVIPGTIPSLERPLVVYIPRDGLGCMKRSISSNLRDF